MTIKQIESNNEKVINEYLRKTYISDLRDAFNAGMNSADYFDASNPYVPEFENYLKTLDINNE